MENNNHHLDSNERPVSENIRDSRGTRSVGGRYDTPEVEQGSDATHELAHGASDKYSEFDSVHLPTESIEVLRCIETLSTRDDTDLTAENIGIVLANGIEMNAFAHDIILGRNQSDDPWVGIDLIMRDIATMGSAPRMRTRPFPISRHPPITMAVLNPSELPKFTGRVELSRAHTCRYQVFPKRVGRTLSAAAVLAAAIVLIGFVVYGADVSSMAIYTLLLLLAAFLTALQRLW